MGRPFLYALAAPHLTARMPCIRVGNQQGQPVSAVERGTSKAQALAWVGCVILVQDAACVAQCELTRANGRIEALERELVQRQDVVNRALQAHNDMRQKQVELLKDFDVSVP